MVVLFLLDNFPEFEKLRTLNRSCVAFETSTALHSIAHVRIETRYVIGVIRVFPDTVYNDRPICDIVMEDTGACVM